MRVSTSTLDLVIVDGTELHLYAPPTYLLKLTLPDRVVDEDAVEESLAAFATVTPGSDDSVVRLVDEVQNSNDNNEDGINESAKLTTPTQLWTKEDLPKLQYNPEKNHGTLVVTLCKEEEGFWQDLDLLGRLQQQPKQLNQQEKQVATSNPLVEVIDADNQENDCVEKYKIDHDNNTEVMEDLLSINNNKNPTYGLFQHFSNVFQDYAREGLAHEMLECPNPDEVYPVESADNHDDSEQNMNRREMRLEMESEKFDSDRYLNDVYVEEEGDMIFDAAMMMVPHWTEGASEDASRNSDESIDNVTSRLSKLSTSENNQTTAFFTAEESHLLATLPPQRNGPSQLTTEQRRSAFLSLTDILFAYAYDHRTTDGDPNVESSWTVMMLSPSLSWLENYNPPYDTIVDVLRWNVRRSLIHPYLRSHTLARKVVEDVCQIIKGGRRTVIRCLLQVHRIMEKSESHYLFNKMYIDPLIGWIQMCEENEVQEFGREVEGLFVNTKKSNDGDDAKTLDVLDKEYLGLGLVELEKSFFEGYDDNGEESSSSVEDDDDESDDDSANYESDSDSRGVEDATVSTTADEEEPTSAASCNNQSTETATSSPKGQKLSVKDSPDLKRVVGTGYSSALLDENRV